MHTWSRSKKGQANKQNSKKKQNKAKKKLTSMEK